MAQTILLKRRTSDATAPTASDLTTGEVAVNAYSGKLYIKKTDGTVTEVSGSGGGGSSFPAVYNTYKYTATNGQTTFSGNDSSSNFLTYNVGNLIVFLNGVLLVPTTDYVATTGNTVVLQDGATTNDILTIVAFTATIGDGNVAVDTFSGDGSTTAFTLAANPQNENNTQVFIDGIYQSKSNYSVSGTTLTFSTAPPNNTAIEVTTGSREVTQYTATTLSLPNAGMSITGGDLDIPSDSRKIKLGASNDLQIFHDGTNNYIQGGTGDLRIDAKSGERGIVVTPDGATTLYHDNAAKIATASGGVTITGTATATTFVGALTGNVTGNVSGNAGTATALANARTIGGVSFDGTANINLPGVNASGSQDTSGNAATATALANARTIGGTSFDGTANIVPATAVSVTGAAQTNITSLGTLTSLTVDTTVLDSYIISQNTSDGSDNSQLSLAGGGADSDGRGARARLYGNEHSSKGGDVDISTGNIANAQMDLYATGHFTVDAGGDINLDADGADINLKDGGTLFGQISNASGLYLVSNVSDAPMYFRGNDGGSYVNALTIDFQNGGRATFASRITFADHILGSMNGGYLQIRGTGDRYWVMGSTGGNTAPTTASATLGFHHYDGSNWSQNKINITASGKLGVGTANPDTELHVIGASNSGIRLKSGAQIAYAPSSSDFYNGLTIENLGSAHAFSVGYGQGARLKFSYFDGSSAYEELATMRPGGDFYPAGSVVFNSGEGISFAPTGQGSGTMSSELLNDYEVGTWNPGVASTGSMTVSNAKYTKIGNMVTITVNLYGFTNRTSGASLGINGLPFAKSAGTGSSVGGLIGRYMDKVVSPYVSDNGTVIYFYTVDSGGYTTLKHNNLNNADSDFHFTLTYFVAA